jgi:flagellar hook-length control protein FliK
MALHPSTHAHSPTHASHASHAHAAHAASKAKPSLTAEDGEGGGFAAQLLKAQPAADKDAKAVDNKPKADAAKKPTEDKDGKASADGEAKSRDGKDDKDAKTIEAKAPPVDPNALMAPPQPVAPPTTSLADKTVATSDHDDFASDPLGALRAAASAKPGRTGKDDDGKSALLASLGAGKQAPGAAPAAGAQGKGAFATGDIAAALAKAEGAVKAATDARDSLAAMLPQADPVVVQAGAVGAPVNALMDASHGTHAAAPTPPAQATLPMTPQSPTFAPALGHQIEVWMKGGVQHAEVQLNPQDLGPIRVKIEMDGAQARVQMSADVQSTRDALQQAMPQLSEQLGQVGLSLSGGGVSDQPAFQQAQAQANADGGSGGGRSGVGGHAAAGQGGGLEDIATASAARQQAQRRGLLDLYA